MEIYSNVNILAKCCTVIYRYTWHICTDYHIAMDYTSRSAISVGLISANELIHCTQILTVTQVVALRGRRRVKYSSKNFQYQKVALQPSTKIHSIYYTCRLYSKELLS